MGIFILYFVIFIIFVFFPLTVRVWKPEVCGNVQGPVTTYLTKSRYEKKLTRVQEPEVLTRGHHN